MWGNLPKHERVGFLSYRFKLDHFDKRCHWKSLVRFYILSFHPLVKRPYRLSVAGIHKRRQIGLFI